MSKGGSIFLISVENFGGPFLTVQKTYKIKPRRGTNIHIFCSGGSDIFELGGMKIAGPLFRDSCSKLPLVTSYHIYSLYS